MLPHLVMLHGIGGRGDSLSPLADLLRPVAQIEMPNLLGHGGRPLPPSFSVPAIAEDVIAFLDSRQLTRVFFLGYSFGGCLALYLARHFPQRVQGAILLGTKFIFDEPTIKYWTYLADPERLARPGSTSPAELEKMHHPVDWKALTLTNRRFIAGLGAQPPISDDDLAQLNLLVLVLSGEQDLVVPMPEALALARRIKGATVSIFPGNAHPLIACPLPVVAKTMSDWLTQVSKT